MLRFDREEHRYCGKIVFVSKVNLVKDDVIILMSDGVYTPESASFLNLGWSAKT